MAFHPSIVHRRQALKPRIKSTAPALSRVCAPTGSSTSPRDVTEPGINPISTQRALANRTIEEGSRGAADARGQDPSRADPYLLSNPLDQAPPSAPALPAPPTPRHLARLC